MEALQDMFGSLRFQTTFETRGAVQVAPLAMLVLQQVTTERKRFRAWSCLLQRTTLCVGKWSLFPEFCGVTRPLVICSHPHEKKWGISTNHDNSSIL